MKLKILLSASWLMVINVTCMQQQVPIDIRRAAYMSSFKMQQLERLGKMPQIAKCLEQRNKTKCTESRTGYQEIDLRKLLI